MKGILGSGTKDYVLIRVSAIVHATYFFLIGSLFILNSPLSFDYWNQLYSSLWMKLFTSFSVFAFAESIFAWAGRKISVGKKAATTKNT